MALDKGQLNRNNSGMRYQVEFGLVLQKARLDKNLSQAELAKQSKLDRTFISLMERGLRQPSLKTIFQLATALNIKPSFLITQIENRLRRERWKRLKS